jgi:hypothetical protein
VGTPSHQARETEQARRGILFEPGFILKSQVNLLGIDLI